MRREFHVRFREGAGVRFPRATRLVVGFQQKTDAERFLEELRERFTRFGLELHPDKTRLIQFGRYAAEERKRRGPGKPETFDFLGFTHICGTSRKGWFQVVRRTVSKRMRAKLKAVKTDLRRRMHLPVPEVGQWLGAVVRGHFQYYGVPLNYQSLSRFRNEVIRLWRWALGRRSQKGYVTWERMERIARRWIPPSRIYHPYPNVRLRVMTQGKSPVR